MMRTKCSRGISPTLALLVHVVARARRSARDLNIAAVMSRSHVLKSCHALASRALKAPASQPRHFSNLPETTIYGGPVSQSAVKRFTLRQLMQKYAKKEPITMVTAYDYPSAVHVDQAGIDIALVGDSVAMVVHGHDTTLPVTLDDMLLHCKAVARGARRPLLVGDLPFGSYEQSPQQAVDSATRMLKEGNMDSVKMEGGIGSRVAAAKAISEAGIAVMGHVGLTPQAISILGGFRPQGRSSARALLVLEHALALQAAGCFSVVLECVPSPVAAAITTTLKIPTIGIGAGPKCSGQVLVYHDLLGMMQHPHYAKVTPKFCKKYAKIGEVINSALEEYNREVTSGEFPSGAHTPYRLENNQLDFFIEDLQKNGFHDAAEAANKAALQDEAVDSLLKKTSVV
ncbi:3-methyl-2-oxobutanoate hydroxymethyltransferase [Marchantia polymorpha subsp. ruderalis]|uniref:3-methyl-2-oxobutanoate hydroxymethyltransferase n=2 Tax=Marchantia polymorpha TaxID=3197 RepID=A0AAF6BMT6_MARPO|nr:hypothetical protein MARPO_0035s0043 [Marchantia polymorpha]BBN13320.1 hypothetical protein Mp_6g02560 [Marchantia polymorpha subsp. ruderalis]|eukprot:PTQ41249.1 hypothetical protein MARPO_0035s0043 [Marchantia polymorpha]